MLPILSTGVDLPNDVYQALEEERLVFFCGAGISVYTDLPDFRRLTIDVFRRCNVPLAERAERHADFCETFARLPGKPWEVAFWQDKFDRALGLLEVQTPPGAMRRYLSERLLECPPETEKDCGFHQDLLELSALKGGGYRLVTTNFDNRFHLASKTAKASGRHRASFEPSQTWEAPRIATPRAESWRSLTFLHGRILDQAAEPSGLNDLVITSADFGRAYLQDGWAARFVVELFREFTVLFIGYSINDPVMTYLVDAIAMDRASGRPFRQPYALVGAGAGADRKATASEWRSKRVEPILYDSADRHAALRKTITKWRELQRGGFDSRFGQALEILSKPYEPKSGEDQNVKALVWALTAPDGSVAKAIANSDLQSAPESRTNISWLRALLAWSDNRSNTPVHSTRSADPLGPPHNPFGSFCVDGYWIGDPLSPPAKRNDSGSHIRLTHLFECAGRGFDEHPITWHLARWIAAHLYDRELALIVAERNGKISDTLRDEIIRQIEHARDLLPEDLVRFWRIVVFAHDRRRNHLHETQPVIPRHLTAEGVLDAESRARFLDRFEPIPSIREPARQAEEARDADAEGQEAGVNPAALPVIQLADYSDDYGLAETIEWIRKPEQRSVLADLAPDLSECLQRTLRLADWIEDTSPLLWHRIPLPSLFVPDRERSRCDWVDLVYLCRDGMTALMTQDQSSGERLLATWAEHARRPWGMLFSRLALHACASDGCSPELGRRILLDNPQALLWETEVESELASLLESLGRRLPRDQLEELVQMIRKGPSRQGSGD